MDYERRKSSTTSEKLRAMVPWATRKAKSRFNKKHLRRRLQILRWLPDYNLDDAFGDVMAGITVGLTIIPQSMAYATIANIPPQYGLYGSFFSSFIYIIFGSCKDVSLGPTAMLALMTYQSIDEKIENAILLCFLSGFIMILMGVFCLGFLIDFVSGPVSSGFTSAVAVIIISSQIKDILGIKAEGGTFIQIWTAIIENIQKTKLMDLSLGIVCLIILFSLRTLTQLKTEKNESKNMRAIKKTLWMIGTSRNALLLIVCSTYNYLITFNESPFQIIGHVPAGMPRIKMPPLQINRNGTIIPFDDMLEQISSGAIVIPLIAILEHITVCKAFANGKTIDVNQEFVALGVANVFNSFCQGFPGTGSLSRSAIIESSGVRTPMNCLYSGLLVILALLFLTPYFYYIPKATLGAIIIAAVVFMVQVRVVKPIWKTKKKDIIPGFSTFFACLVLPIQFGILIGISLNIIFILYHAARPKIAVQHKQINIDDWEADYLVITPDRSLIFPSADYVRYLVNKHSLKKSGPVVIDCSHIYSIDYTAAKVIEAITQDFVARKQLLLFYKLKPSVSSVFESLSKDSFHVFFNQEDMEAELKRYITTNSPKVTFYIENDPIQIPDDQSVRFDDAEINENDERKISNEVSLNANDELKDNNEELKIIIEKKNSEDNKDETNL